MLQTWIKLFFRNSKKNWLNLVVNISGLTLGFAGLLIVLLYFNDELSYNKLNPDRNEIFRVIHKMSDGDVWATSTKVEGAKYEEDIPEIEDYYLSNSWYENALVKVNDKKIYTRDILEGRPNFFDFFPFKIIEGNTTTFKQARNTIAISQQQAEIFFGNESAIGKSIDLSNRIFTVTTVYQIEGKHYFMPEMVIQYEKQPLESRWGNFSNTLFVKTIKNPELEDLEEKALAIWYENEVLPSAKKQGITPEKFMEKYGTTPVFESLNDIRLKTISDDSGPEGSGNYQLILIMLSLSILLIIISCVNFINLSIASATQRAKEVGIKKTFGLSKGTLIRQYALEIVLQSFVAFILSLLLVELILPYFNHFMNKEISILDIGLLIKIGVLTFLISLFIGIVPAIYISKFKSVEVLKGNISRSKKGVFARNIMLGIQFLISGFFLTGSIIINKQVGYMIEKDLGFNGDQVIMISMNKYKDRYKNYLLAKNELIKHPNIEAVTSNSFIIGGGSSNSTNFNYKDLSVQTNANAIEYNYLDVMNIKLLKGRGLQEEIASDTIKNILINETLAKALHIYDDPIGKKLSAGFQGDNNDGKNLIIVGMVKDYHVTGLDGKIPPTAFMHWNSFDWMKQNFWTIQLKVKPTNVSETLGFIEDYWKENIEQGYPFNPIFVNKRFSRTYRKYQKQQTLFFILTSIVIIISLLGLFALATLTIQQRLKEVAIRKTLGASVKEIMFELLKSFLKITIIASVTLIPIAYYFMQNWLDNFVYRIDMPIWPYIITPIILVVLVFIVVGVKALNATKIDLIKYLKFE
ncbi:ABC transporter permease [Kordia sp.]|uniref:ABC transporter permease n=1 Tax=Kordia sp. TaxID=1965332 RepID=UPI003D2A67EA